MTALDDMLAQAQAQQAAQQRAALTPPAQRPFAQAAPSEAATPTPAPAPSLLDKIGGFIKGVTDTTRNPETDKAVLAGMVRAPGQLLGGMGDLGQDMGKFINDNIAAPFVRATGTAGYKGPRAAASPNVPTTGGASLADTLSDRQGLGQVGNKGINQFTAQATAVAATLPFGGEGATPEGVTGLSKVMAGAGHILTNSAKFGVATAAVSDPRSQRVSDLLQSVGVHNAVIDYLASNPTDTDSENRLKNGIEGALGNAAVEPLLGAVGGIAKMIKSSMAGDAKGLQAAAAGVPHGVPLTTVSEATPQEALQENLDRAFASGRTQEARYQQQEQALAEQPPEAGLAGAAPSGPDSSPVPKPSDAGTVADHPTTQQFLDQGTRHTDAAPAPEGSGDVPPTPSTLKDANSALEKAGAAERVTPDHVVSPDGRYVVHPETKQAADEAGVGRAFAASNETPKDQVIFKEEDGQGGKRVVGMMGKDDLEGFVKDAQYYVDHPGQINIVHGEEDQGHYVPSGLDSGLTASRVGQWSVGKLGAVYDVGAYMRALADRLPGMARPTTNLEIQTAAKAGADATGLEPSTLMNLGSQVAGSSHDLAVGIQVVRTLQARILEDIVGLKSLPFNSLEEGAPELTGAYTKVNNAMKFASLVEESKSGAGLALHVNSLPDADSYLANVGKGAAKDAPPREPAQIVLPKNKAELQQWLDQLEAARVMGNADAIQKFLSGKTFTPGKWNYLGNSFANFFTGAIVSAPRTLVRDLWGPAIISGFNTVGRMAGDGMLALNPLLTDAQRAEAWTASWGAARAHATALSDALDALKSAAKTTGAGFTKGISSADPYWDPFHPISSLGGSNLGNTHSRLTGSNPIDINSAGIPRSLIDAAMGRDGAGVTGAVPYWIGNALNKLPQAVMALHGGFNEFAQRLAYLGEIRASAYNEASKLGLQGADFKQYLEQRLTDAQDPLTGAATDATAVDQAQRTTLVRSPQPSDGAGINLAFSIRHQIVSTFPPFRFIMPIFTVPANQLGESLRKVPGLAFAFEQSRRELSGELGIPAMGEAYGRQMTGAAALTAGYVLGTSGVLTGAGPTNADDRKVWLQTHQPYSIRVGGTWYSYAKSDVVGPMLSIMAAFYDKSLKTTGDMGNHAIAATAGLAEYFKDQAAMQGLAQVLNFGGDPQEAQGDLTKILGQESSGFVPGFLAQIRDQLDPYARVHHTIGDFIMDRIPGLSTTLDPVRNVLGEPVMKPKAGLGGTLPISYSSVATWEKEPVLDELSRMLTTTGEAFGVRSPSLGSNTGVDMRDVKLENGQSLYDALMQRRMFSQNDNGQTLKQALYDLVVSDDYHDALEIKSTHLTDEDGNPIKGSMIRQTFDDFERIAKQDVAQSSPIARRYLAMPNAIANHPIAAQGHTTPELAGNPGLMKDLGININDYEDRVSGQ